MKAFEKFKEIEKLHTHQEKHRLWLKEYEGLAYSIAYDEKHQMKWKTEPKYYFDKIWKPNINLIKEKKDRLKIEFDGEEKQAKENLEKVHTFLKKKGWRFNRSTNKGKYD